MATIALIIVAGLRRYNSLEIVVHTGDPVGELSNKCFIIHGAGKDRDMDAAKVADAVIFRLIKKGGLLFLREIIIEEIGKEVVAEACACVKHWRHDKS